MLEFYKKFILSLHYINWRQTGLRSGKMWGGNGIEKMQEFLWNPSE